MATEHEVVKVATSTPWSMQEIIPTLWMIAIAAFGGVVSFYHKVKAGKARPYNFVEFIGEIITSCLVGLVTFWLCKAFGVNEWLSAAGVAISGHMGARALFLLEHILEKKTKEHFGVDHGQ